MMQGYGRAVIEDRLNPQRFAEIAGYVRAEYGRGIGPGFLVAEALSGAAGSPRKRRQGASRRTIGSIVRAIRSWFAGPPAVPDETASNPTR